jgi:hypothetical protein
MGYNTGNINKITKEELDNYLVSIGGLERSWRKDLGPIFNTNFFAVDEGWYGLIKSLIEELIEAGWDKKLVQVKEKFGGLHFYIENSDELSYAIISKYEKLSYKVCEKCGSEGVLRKGAWLKTLCDEHSDGREEMIFNEPPI